MQRPANWSTAENPPITRLEMSIEPAHPSRYPVTSAPGAIAALRATVPGPSERPVVAERPAPLELDPGPTPDALTAVQVAAQAYEVLLRAGRELHFETEDGVMRIEVYDGTGRLIRSIPPNEALALALEEASWQA